MFPLAAYQKIYQDFHRWSQWENADPTSYNFDWFNGDGPLFGSTGLEAEIGPTSGYWKRDNLFSLRYCNWNKDMFMGILPNSQFGDVAVVDIPTPVVVADKQIASNNQLISVSSGSSSSGYTIGSTNALTLGRSIVTPGQTVNATGSMSILALRQAEALQKYREITQSVDTNYREQIKAHFGVNVPASDSHMAQYIGGIARNLDISEVVNNNLQGEDRKSVV